MVVHPVVEDPGYDFAWVVPKVVEDADVRVAGDLGPLLADSLEGPEVFGRHGLIRLGAVGPEQQPAVRVEGDSAGDVVMLGDEFDEIIDFRLAAGERPRAILLVLLPPLGGKVAV